MDVKEMQEKFKDFLKESEENVTEFSLEGIKSIQDQLKSLEEKIKENSQKKKLKTISISEEVHTEIKKYTTLKEEKMGDWVEKTLKDAIK